tara:strand:- start:1098 stop:1562 length:465 start_codon:yes stop_codon:yes gene_type:complete
MGLTTKIVEIVGTVFFLGRLPIAPGTWGSAGALIGWYFLFPYIDNSLFLLINLGLFFVGVVTANILIEVWDEEDPSAFVLDEWVGQWIALWLLPHSFIWGLVAFFWFRIFDIFKPGPVQLMDNMKTGAGVMLDDIVAGILALFVTQSLYIFWIR